MDHKDPDPEDNVLKILQYQIVAEVVKSEHCFSQVQVGDKLVFEPLSLKPEKFTGVMCVRALLPLTVQINSLFEMISEWAESGKEELPEIVYRKVRCLDPGFEDGGVGGVLYQIRAEKIST